jgi:hypothetical protein
LSAILPPIHCSCTKRESVFLSFIVLYKLEKETFSAPQTATSKTEEARGLRILFHILFHTMTTDHAIDSQQHPNGENKSPKNAQTPPPTPMSSIVLMAVIVLLTIVTCPSPLQPVGKPTLLHVWYYGWITAVSTGLGVLPLVFMPNLDSYWVGISNGETMELCGFCIVG